MAATTAQGSSPDAHDRGDDDQVLVVALLTAEHTFDDVLKADTPTIDELAKTAGIADYETGHAPTVRRIVAGRTASKQRIIVLSHLRYLELHREAEREAKAGTRSPLTPTDLQALRDQARAEVIGDPLTAEDEAAIDEWMCSSTWTEAEGSATEQVVMRAVLMLGVMSWLYSYLCQAVNRAGFAPARRWVAATFLCMAWSKNAPEIEATRNRFTGADLVNYSFDYPKDDLHRGRLLNRAERRALERAAAKPSKVALQKGQFGASLHKMLLKDCDPEVLQHIQVDLFRRFAAQQVTSKRGAVRPRHPKAGIALVADGSFVQAAVTQRFPQDEEDRLNIVGEGRGGVQYLTYAADGNYYKRNLGYRLVVLCCAATGRCIIAGVFPGDKDEPSAVLCLLRRLFELWPDCPAEYLVGDRLYGHSKKFLRTLIFDYGLWPVTSWRADYPADGLPVCTCNAAAKPHPKDFLKFQDKFWGPSARLARDANGSYEKPRGESAPRQLRITYACPYGTCANETVSVWGDPRIFSPLPHRIGPASSDVSRRRHSTRRALLWQRNVVESFYNAVQRLGHQGFRGNRPRWAKDREMAWLLGAAVAYTTARRLAFELGYYEKAEAEASKLRLLNDATLDDPTPGPDAEALAAARADRVRWGQTPKPPATWNGPCGSLSVLRGSAAVRPVPEASGAIEPPAAQAA